MLSSEVLPAPFGPMIETISPLPTAIVTSSTARTPPKCLFNPLAASCGRQAATSALMVACDLMLAVLPPRRMRRRYGWYDARAKRGTQPAVSGRRGLPRAGQRGLIAPRYFHRAVRPQGASDMTTRRPPPFAPSMSAACCVRQSCARPFAPSARASSTQRASARSRIAAALERGGSLRGRDRLAAGASVSGALSIFRSAGIAGG